MGWLGSLDDPAKTLAVENLVLKASPKHFEPCDQVSEFSRR